MLTAVNRGGESFASEVVSALYEPRATKTVLVVNGFDLAQQDGPSGSQLWIHDDDQGDVEGVINFVLRLAEELNLSGLWGFDFAHTCSRPRVEAFGGGAHVIDLGARKSLGWISTHEWLTAALNGEDIDAVEAVAG